MFQMFTHHLSLFVIVPFSFVSELSKLSFMSKPLNGKNILITGANTGIGRETALELAKQGANLYLACRSLEKTQSVLDEIKALGGSVSFLNLDLGDLAAVRACAQDFLALNVPLHVLINNAGLAGLKGLTKDGFEMAFGVNHLGHFLFTLLLLKQLDGSKDDPARIVNVASMAHYDPKELNFEALQKSTATVTGYPEYCVSKLCNVLFSAELNRKLQLGELGTEAVVHTYALHPGVVASDVWRGVPFFIRPFIKLFMINNQEGAKTSLHCATSDAAKNETGLYYHSDTKVKEPSKLAQDEALAKELWRRSLAWTGLSD